MLSSAFRNPIIPGFNPDPTIVRVGVDFFLCTSTFEFFPGIAIYHSRDIVSWRLIGHCLTRPSQLSLGQVGTNGGIFAPTLRYYEGRYFMTTTFQNIPPGGPHKLPLDSLAPPRGFYVWTDNIWDSSTWSEPIYFDVTGIDQDLFFDKDGKVYLSTSLHLNPSHGKGPRAEVAACEVDLMTGRSLTYPKTIRCSAVPGPLPTAEGSHIFRKGEFYYLITAEGGTGELHQEWVCRSRDGVYGPWEPGPQGLVNPMVYNGDDIHVRNTGHMDFVEGLDGRWWAVLLAVRPQYEDGVMLESQLGRETFLCPVEWKDDWPIVNHRQPVGLQGLAPTELHLAQISQTSDQSFNFGPTMDLYLDGWYHLRTPVKQEYDLSLRQGSLALYGGPYDLRCEEAISMLLQKQKAFKGLWLTDIDFQPDKAGLEAGVTVWWSRWAFASLGVRGSSFDGGLGKELVFRYPSAEPEDFKEACHPVKSNDTVRVRISAQPLSYTFEYAVKGDAGDEYSKFVAFPPVPSRLIAQTRPCDSRFTGANFGLYGTGIDDHASLVPAFFTNVAWKEQL